MPSKASDSTTLEIESVRQGRMEITLLGTTPLVCNRMAEKAKRELLFPAGRKTAADKAASLKHDPLAEYRASVHRLDDAATPTLIGLPATAFKAAMGTAALDLAGARKAQIGRLVYVEGESVAVYGEPRLLLSVVRMADMGHTPDIRSRAILPSWACQIVVRFVIPVLNETNIANLVTAAGTTVGVGDYRQEKGKGSYGLFEMVDDDDPRFLALQPDARAIQDRALTDPACYDTDSAELLEWYTGEIRRRGPRSSS